MANIITSRKSKPLDRDRLARGLEKRDSRGRSTYSEMGESMAQADKARRECIESARKLDRANNGFTKERQFRRVARIPVEAMLHFRKSADVTDRKTLKKWIRASGFNTVDGRSF